MSDDQSTLIARLRKIGEPVYAIGGELPLGSDQLIALEAADTIERLRAALAAQAAPGEPQWQPIETAPKDGTEVLVLLNIAEVPIVHIAWYRGREEWEASGQLSGGWDSLSDWLGWWSYTRGSVTQERLCGARSPTHWMPLPATPRAD